MADYTLLQLLAQDLPSTVIALLIPAIFLYASLYAFTSRWTVLCWFLSAVTLAMFCMCGNELGRRVECAGLRALGRFAVAAGIMKLLDVHALSLTSSFPSYTAGPPPRPSIMALLLLTELRYESFNPNPIRLAHPPMYPFPNSPRNRQRFYSEQVQLLIHFSFFLILQSLPQHGPVKALGVLLTIYNIWTGLQCIVRYRTSPALFGPIYLADSLQTFWTATWHNAFASPCITLAYTPMYRILSRVRVPRSISRSTAVISSFGLMAAFHMYSLVPIMTREGVKRIGIFFVGNGVLTVFEVAVWGKKRHWLRTALAWALELSIASWTVETADMPDGLLSADWRGLCRRRSP